MVEHSITNLLAKSRSNKSQFTKRSYILKIQFESEVFMFYNRAMRQLRLIRSEINEIEAKLRKLPEGNFTCHRNRDRYKWRVTIGKQHKNIPKDNQSLAEIYAYKTYITLRLARLQNEEKAIQAYLKVHDRHVKKSEDKLLSHPEYQKLLSQYFLNTKETMLRWMHAPFEANSYHKEHLIHDTDGGIKTRSKAEQMIEAALRRYNIPYRYEEKLEIGDAIYYPDFKIIHPKTGEIIIWENIGMIDNPKYMANLLGRLHNYFLHGYYPTVNLILTFDTEENPLTTDRIERIIEMYFDM